MEAVGQKYGFTPATRGERIASEVREVRQKARGEAANYDRPLKGKPATEAGLPEYKAVQEFAKATKTGFPPDTLFDVKVRRIEYPEFDGEEEILSEQAVVDSRFSRSGMSGQIRRNFYRDRGGDLVAKHDVFVIEGAGKGEGIGRQVLKAQFDEYDRMGVKKVTLHANIDVGGYAWARFGFTPKQSDWDDLRKSLNVWVNADDVSHDILGNEYPALKIPKPQRKALTKILDNPDSKGLWKSADARIGDRNIGKEILMERDWRGEIRLDDAEAMARFNHYVGRSK
jgi:hypothetical protein